jgi:tRNA-dihydrouridine synthase C
LSLNDAGNQASEASDKFAARDWNSFWSSEDRVLLAPMEGVVDSVMRDVLTRIGGVDLCVTEFIRVTDRCLPENEFRKYAPELFDGSGSRTRAGTTVLVQLLGGKPAPMAETAAYAASLGAPGIDLNFGCPAKTVNRHDGGATLLKNPERIDEVVSAVRRAVPVHLPVSAKVRLGFENKDQVIAIAQAAESGGASWLTVHARTRDEGYRPPAHWEYIARMRESVKIPVIANGEIWTLEDYANARRVSGCRHVMIGRGLMAKPELARMIKGVGIEASRAEMLAWLREFAELSRIYRHEHYAVCRVKQWLKSFSRHSTFALELFESLKRFDELAPILEGLELSEKARVPSTEAHFSSGSSFASRSNAASSV